MAEPGRPKDSGIAIPRPCPTGRTAKAMDEDDIAHRVCRIMYQCETEWIWVQCWWLDMKRRSEFLKLWGKDVVS